MENTNTKNLKHMYDITHATPDIPAVTGIYTHKLHKTFNKKSLTLPPQISANGAKFCEHCLNVLIPGVNMSMRIAYTKRSKKKLETWRPRDRKMVIDCFSCNKTMKFDLFKPADKQKKKGTFVAEWKAPVEAKKDVANKAKERAKKRKKNSLSSLLSSKKEADAKEKKMSSLLSLDEFMQM